MKVSRARLLVIPLLISLFAILTATPFAAATVLRATTTSQIVICGCVCICAIPHFDLVASSTSLSTPYNHLSDTATISANSVYNYNGTVSLSATVSPSVTNGLSTSFSSSSICVGYVFFCTTYSSLLTVTAQSNTPNGDYTVTVSGTGSAGGTSTVVISVNVPSPFVIVPSPPTITPVTGESQDTSVTVQSLFGFGGTVSLTASTTPSGPSASFAPPTVMITGSFSATSTLTFDTAAIGNYSVTIIGTSGAFTNSAMLSANATDFSMKNNPGTNVQAGSPYSSKVDIGSLNGFAGTVQLSATVKPSGPKVTLSPNTLTISSGGKASTTVTILASDPGTYTVNVTGTNGGASRSTVYTVTIAPLPPTILGLAPMSFYGLAGGLATAGVVGGAVVVTRRRKSAAASMPASPPSMEGAGAVTTSASQAGPAAPTATVAAPEASKKGLSKVVPSGFQFPKPLVLHKIPILLVSAGTVLVVAALATISAAAGLFGGLFIPGILLLGLGSVVLFSQLYQRPVAVRRFCMHCGFQMPMTGAGACPRCGKQPMSGIDTRVCPNCNAVIPTLAKFCKDCGAGQPNVSAV